MSSADRQRAQMWLGVRTRASKTIWVLLDQGAFALSNFIINILFTRWLSAVDYGWFVLSFSGCQFIANIHNGIIHEPLLVQSSQVQPERRRAYVVSLFRAHVLLLAGSVVLAILGWLGAEATGQRNLGWAIAGGLIGAAAMLTNIIGRRLCLIFISARASAIVGCLYLAGSVLSGLLLHACIPTVWWVDIWLIIAGWSLLGSAATFWLAYSRTTGTHAYPLAEIMRFGRRYLHWGLIASVCGWIRADGMFVMLGWFTGLETVAQTRAIFNLGSPLLQANMAVYTNALVWFSASPARGSKKNIWRIVGIYMIGLLIALPLVGFYAPALVDLFYHGRYAEGAWQLPLYCLTLGLGLLDALVSGVFKAQGVMRSGYASVVVTGAASVALGLLLIPVQQTLIYVIVVTAALGLITSMILRLRAAD